MKRILVVLTLALAFATGANATVPEPFRGTWSLDAEASLAAIEAAADQLTPQQSERLIRGVTVEVAGMAVEVSEGQVIYRIGDQTLSHTLTLQESEEGRAVFTDTDAKRVVLTLNEAGLLNIRAEVDDDFDQFYFARATATQRSASTPPPTGPSDAVAYLDALKTCTAGRFELSFPGIATLENTILGPNGESCEVRIVRGDFALYCEYSARMIELLTSEKMYEEARSGVLSGSTDEETSQLASEQCLPE